MPTLATQVDDWACTGRAETSACQNESAGVMGHAGAPGTGLASLDGANWSMDAATTRATAPVVRCLLVGEETIGSAVGIPSTLLEPAGSGAAGAGLGGLAVHRLHFWALAVPLGAVIMCRDQGERRCTTSSTTGTGHCQYQDTHQHDEPPVGGAGAGRAGVKASNAWGSTWEQRFDVQPPALLRTSSPVRWPTSSSSPQEAPLASASTATRSAKAPLTERSTWKWLTTRRGPNGSPTGSSRPMRTPTNAPSLCDNGSSTGTLAGQLHADAGPAPTTMSAPAVRSAASAARRSWPSSRSFDAGEPALVPRPAGGDEAGVPTGGSRPGANTGSIRFSPPRQGPKVPQSHPRRRNMT